MRNPEECLAKAFEMDALALACETATGTGEYRQLAKGWRQLARQATWQAAYDI